MRTMWAIVAAALAASTAPAAADWQYTRWGMTPDQVEAASNGAARTNPDRGLDADGVRAALVAPYQGETLPFTAVFLFNAEGGLRYVTLNPVGTIACPSIVQTLTSHYGRPEGEADMVHATTMRWDDPENGNLVVYLDLGGGNCTVQYSKLPNTRPDAKNL